MADYRSSEAMQRDHAFWLSGPRLRPTEPMPADFEGGIHTDLNSRRVIAPLPSGLADRLLDFVRSSPGVSFNDLLLYGVARAWSRWAGPRVLRMDVENNGRGGLLEAVDLSRTVGPTTLKIPILFDVPASLPPGAAFEAARNIVRETLSHGLGYGLLRYGPDPSVSQQLAACGSPQVFFNNRGAVLTGPQQAASPMIAGESFSPKRLDGKANVISYDLMIECDGAGSGFQMSWVYSPEIHREETIRALARGVFDALAGLTGQAEEEA
jgi:non-ribosomal peptide synthase protein (TIGR01720 family)